MTDLLSSSYAALAETVEQIGDDDAWSATGCVGWVVRDLVFHLHSDAVRGLVALHTPADGPVDTDAVSYWRAWGVDAEGAEQSRRFTRLEAGLFDWSELRARHLEAARAVVHAHSLADPAAVVATQAHRLTVADLASTLAVEATLHHLDLVARLAGSWDPPPAAGLAEVRRVVSALLGRELSGWSDERLALVATGRARPTQAERADLDGVDVPVFA